MKYVCIFLFTFHFRCEGSDSKRNKNILKITKISSILHRSGEVWVWAHIYNLTLVVIKSRFVRYIVHTYHTLPIASKFAK